MFSTFYYDVTIKRRKIFKDDDEQVINEEPVIRPLFYTKTEHMYGILGGVQNGPFYSRSRFALG